MPLYKTITISGHTKLLIWKIEESFDELFKDTPLTTHCLNRVQGMKDDLHRRGFMSVRHLLKELGYTDFDLYYDEKGKPHLKDGKKISITHSFIFSAIIVSEEEVGIDIEMQRAKILKIASKFTTVEDYRSLEGEAVLIRKLTMVWGAKESLYKSFAEKGVSFLQHIYVEDFDMDILSTTAIVNYKGKSETYTVYFEEFEGFTCAFALLNRKIA